VKKILGLIALFVLAGSAIWLVRQRGAEERAIQQLKRNQTPSLA
jgi:hypothetical protein